MDAKTARIRALNDDMRRNLYRERALITPGVAALGPVIAEQIVRTVMAFDDFSQANDPHQEHDFGAFEANGNQLFFKIDYYDMELQMHSPDPADPAVTQRVITIMLAEEY